MTVIESFIEFKKYDPLSSKNKGKGAEEKDKKEGYNKPLTWKGKPTIKDTREKKDKGPLKCFLCDKPHSVRDYPTRAKLLAMVREEEKEGEAQMSLIFLLNSLKFHSSSEQ